MTDFLTNTVAFFFALGVIIFIHELGHHLVAKGFGMRVMTFSLGFGRRLWGFERGGTDYRLSLFPLGGYVKLSGEHPDEHTGEPGDFLSHPRWQRVLVYLAGPAMNAVLSILLVTAVFMIGIEVPALQTIPAVVGSVEAGGPGDLAGFEPSDLIREMDGKKVERWQEVLFHVMTSPDRAIPVVIERQGSIKSLELTPALVPKYEFGTAGLYPKILPKISAVDEGGPAALAGFEIGDEVRSVDGRAVVTTSDFAAYIESRPGEAVVVEVGRGENAVEIEVQPGLVELPDGREVGRIGVGLTAAVNRKLPLGEAFVESLHHNVDIVKQTVMVIGKIFQRQIKARSALSGPIEIAAISGEAARTGFAHLLYLMGFISISVGLLNLFPIPVLDGGQIAMLLVEIVVRRDLSIRIKEWVNLMGFVVLVALMVTVIGFDIAKRLPPGWIPGAG